MRFPAQCLLLAFGFGTGPGLRAQDEFLELRIEKVGGNYRFTDGPVWTPEKRLLFSEIPSNTVYQWVPGQKVEPFRKDLNGVQAITFDAQERMYVCESKGRRVLRQDKKGKMEVLAEQWEGKKLNGCNDIVVRKDGNVYFTDSVFGAKATASRQMDFNGIYHISPKGELQVIAKWKSSRPNGITISPNGRTLYVTSSDDRKVVSFDLDKNGVATNEAVFIHDIAGVAGGIRCDEKGHLFIAAGGIHVYQPDGKKIRVIELQDPPSNLAFGESDLQSLFVTTRRSLYRIRMPYRGSLPYFSIPAPTLAP